MFEHFGNRLRTRGAFYESLAAAVDAGLPVERALATLAESGDATSAALLPRVTAGHDLSDAMATAGSSGPSFDDLEVQAVRAGEHAGHLPLVLRRLGRAFHVRGRSRDRLAYGLFYPVVLLHGAVLLPPIHHLFGRGLGAYLGVVAPLLLTVYAVLAVGWWLLRGVAATDAGRARLDALALKLPLVGKAARSRALADYSLAFLTLYGAGVPMLQTLERAADACGNAIIRDAGHRLAGVVRSGGTLRDGLSRERGVFPQSFVQALAVGEAAGKLDEALAQAEESARRQSERALLTLAIALAVIAYAVAALVVAWIVIDFWTGITRLPEGI